MKNKLSSVCQSPSTVLTALLLINCVNYPFAHLFCLVKNELLQL